MTIKNIKIKTRENLGNTYYMVVGDTERYGKQEVLFEGIHLCECEKYLKMEEVPDSQIKELILHTRNSELLRDYDTKSFNGMNEYYFVFADDIEIAEAKTDNFAISKALKFAKDNDLALKSVEKFLYDDDGEEIEETLTIYDREIGKIIVNE